MFLFPILVADPAQNQAQNTKVFACSHTSKPIEALRSWNSCIVSDLKTKDVQTFQHKPLHVCLLL